MKYILLSLLLLAGCSSPYDSTVYPDGVRKADELCQNHNGWRYYYHSNIDNLSNTGRTNRVWVTCKDGVESTVYMSTANE